jgi:hypothetical protein
MRFSYRLLLIGSVAACAPMLPEPPVSLPTPQPDPVPAAVVPPPTPQAPPLAAYDQESLRKAARASHYWLQTHLYLVALSRYLGPQADIRGAWLIYLRGVKSGTPNSVLHIKPSPALLQGLDSLFTRPNA